MADVRGVKCPTAKEQEASRQLRKELMEQKQNAQRNKEVLCDINTNRLDEAVKRLDQVRERGEALGDGFQKSKDVSAQAEILRTLAGYGVVAANKLVQQQQGRGPIELIRALRATFVHTSDPQMDGETDPMAFCWSELAAATESLRRPARGPNCMLGPMEAKVKERKAPTQRQKRQELAQVERPDEVPKIDEDKQDTDRKMEVMWQVITAQPQPQVPLSELVCNHHSFAQTVENIFTLLFLVKDNRVALGHDAHLGIMVQALRPDNGPAAPGGAGGAAAGGGGGGGGQGAAKVQQQFIASFNMDDWDIMCKLVPPSDCLMPHREVPGSNVAAGKRQHASPEPEQAGKKKQRR